MMLGRRKVLYRTITLDQQGLKDRFQPCTPSRFPGTCFRFPGPGNCPALFHFSLFTRFQTCVLLKNCRSKVVQHDGDGTSPVARVYPLGRSHSKRSFVYNPTVDSSSTWSGCISIGLVESTTRCSGIATRRRGFGGCRQQQ